MKHKNLNEQERLINSLHKAQEIKWSSSGYEIHNAKGEVLFGKIWSEGQAIALMTLAELVQSKTTLKEFTVNENALTYFQRLRIVIISLLFLGQKRRQDFKCWDFVKLVLKIALIPKLNKFTNIPGHQKENPPFGTILILLEKGVTGKRWSHVGIVLPFGFFLHMSYYWGEKVIITPISKIWERYDLAV